MKNKSTAIKLVVAGLFIVLVGGGLVWSASNTLNNINNPKAAENEGPPPSLSSFFSSFEDALSQNDALSELKTRKNILLLGIGGKEHISGELTDTIIVASIDPESNSMDLFSIPRDLWVKDNDKFQKINELYGRAGGGAKPQVSEAETMKNKVEDITGLKVHNVAIVDFDGVSKLVDLIGGITTDSKHMNGDEALWYVRDRSRAGGDFDRMERQQKLLVAVQKKLRENPEILENSKNLVSFFEIAKENFSTDISTTNILALYRTFKETPIKNIGMHPIVPETGLIYSDHTQVGDVEAYTLHPEAGKENYSQIQKFVSEALN